MRSNAFVKSSMHFLDAWTGFWFLEEVWQMTIKKKKDYKKLCHRKYMLQLIDNAFENWAFHRQAELSRVILSSQFWTILVAWVKGLNFKDTGSNNARFVMVQWYASYLLRSSGLSWMSFLTLELFNHSREECRLPYINQNIKRNLDRKIYIYIYATVLKRIMPVAKLDVCCMENE